jgi:hypothetical protein
MRGVLTNPIPPPLRDGIRSGINFHWGKREGFGYPVYIVLIPSGHRRKYLVREGTRLLLLHKGPHFLPFSLPR